MIRIFSLSIVFLSIAAFSILCVAEVNASTFVVTNGNDAGAGSLRQALLDGNSTFGVDIIEFNINGGGTQQIVLTGGGLPRISEPLIIDGTTQPGYLGSPLVEIKGDGSVFTIDSGGTTIRGLCFGGAAMYANGGNVIQSSFIGVDLSGTRARPDVRAGILMRDSSNNIIGGTSPNLRNLISGNNSEGIRVTGNSSNTTIQGNYIGVGITGTESIPNAREGICICGTGSNNKVGGTSPGAGNVITTNRFDEIAIGAGANSSIVQGNLIGTTASGTGVPEVLIPLGGHGIYISDATNSLIGGDVPGAKNVISGNVDASSYRGGNGILVLQSSGTTIKGNFIGTDITGTAPIPNRESGIHLFYIARNTVVGGTGQGEANVIAFNNRDGILVSSTTTASLPTTRNKLRGNSIFSNGQLGIDLAGGTPAEVNLNDACDSDGNITSPNELQNYPMLTSAVYTGSSLEIAGTLNTAPSSVFTVDFYSSPAADASGFGEGKNYLGSLELTTDGACNATVNAALPFSGQDRFITATATDSNGNTSEFSQAIQASTSRSQFDFDGDGKTDIGIFRPIAGASEWWINRSSTGQTFALQFGASSDRIAPADYTGDGKADIAFFRPSSGEWYVLRSEDSSFFALPFGTNGDVPVPADYDADGKADFAVFRPSTSTWFISQSSGAPTRIFQFGAIGDVPVVSDYDADGKADVGIFRAASGGGEWWIDRSTAGLLALQFGASTDKAVQGDYTGDGKADVAIWRPSSGEWFIVRSEDFSFYGFPFGTTGDIVAPGDYDGDGKFDVTVFRPSNATWFISRTTAGTQIVQFGANGDRPLPNAFVH